MKDLKDIRIQKHIKFMFLIGKNGAWDDGVLSDSDRLTISGVSTFTLCPRMF